MVAIWDTYWPSGNARPAGTAYSVTARRLKILPYEMEDRLLPDHVELLAHLQEAGLAADFAPKSLQDLGMRVERVARFAAKYPAEAWVICSGSEDILSWLFDLSGALHRHVWALCGVDDPNCTGFAQKKPGDGLRPAQARSAGPPAHRDAHARGATETKARVV